jgi:N-acetylglucosaminyl-diphospho-decaprenol L-rhamnosyltransferase
MRPDASVVAAVVVSYKSRGYLERCLQSLVDSGVSAVVVVENGSDAGTEAEARAGGADWIETGHNVGYGRAANLGAQQKGVADSDYVLICNADIEIEPGSVAILAAALDADPSLGAVGPRILNTDGTLYPSARTFPNLVDAMGHGLLGLLAPRNRFTRRYRMLDWDHAEAAEVGWISGACFLARRTAWDAVGGFDPDFFMYLEDVDLCWRMHAAGWLIGYEPQAEVLHVQGVSTDLHPYRMLAAHHRSLWLFARRSTAGAQRLALPVVLAGLIARLAVAVVRRRLAGRVEPSGRAAPRPLA